MNTKCSLIPILLLSTACSSTVRAPAEQLAATSVQTQQALLQALPPTTQAASLQQWWQAQGDPALLQLISAAQAVSPGIAQAWANIETARAARVSSGAALLPTLDATASASRARSQPGMPVSNSGQAGVQTSWEIDVFGAGRASRDASQASLDASRALWHDARISVAAETATQYVNARQCQLTLALTRKDSESRQETARVTALSVKAGVASQNQLVLSQAAAAEGNNRSLQQQAACEVERKALVALTGLPETEVATLLQQAAAQSVWQPVGISSLPASVLNQRPDVYAAEQEMTAAYAEISAAQAQRYPRLTLTGFVGRARLDSGATELTGPSWSLGPVNLTLPLFNGGRLAANVDAAEARYLASASNYQAKVRQAVREVEEALVNLRSAEARQQDAALAARSYAAHAAQTASRYQQGMASLFDLEDARRSAFAAELNESTLQSERRRAWIALYRAAGCGWSTQAALPAAAVMSAGSATSATSAQNSQ
ncbi:efflux transporter outer membrane subunit [Undibacterium curvum]|uniref:efflux transporter outer membrane subunit n=1 Tax=Undibacterium curvum TaxID=2762294 RepID=UPI001E4B053B|nr:efflux transporter outer membrane subunit [Undibacterium curvum]